ncbi:hypothetical protein ACHHYP_20828 [Achlya hypogyna]|uniref:Uncharacterized protein n=1 Tax=Achlya hypogyna TaxID=1202772 RepID=A0A1V9Y608_ACHHY|nr:hypothetical protein ACHHYP_20828 [Achlya hypogyna]
MSMGLIAVDEVFKAGLAVVGNVFMKLFVDERGWVVVFGDAGFLMRTVIDILGLLDCGAAEPHYIKAPQITSLTYAFNVYGFMSRRTRRHRAHAHISLPHIWANDFYNTPAAVATASELRLPDGISPESDLTCLYCLAQETYGPHSIR